MFAARATCRQRDVGSSGLAPEAYIVVTAPKLATSILVC